MLLVCYLTGYMIIVKRKSSQICPEIFFLTFDSRPIGVWLKKSGYLMFPARGGVIKDFSKNDEIMMPYLNVMTL